jgi:hypothetical protein
MKTTLELPDELLCEAKAAAAMRRTTLKALFTRALERELHGSFQPPASQPRFVLDASGWPILQRQESTHPPVTDDFIRSLRDAEGI